MKGNRLQRALVWAMFLSVGLPKNLLAANYKNFPAQGQVIGHNDAAVFLCHLSELAAILNYKLVGMNPSEENKAKFDSVSGDSRECARDAQDKGRPLYPGALKEAHRKPSSEIKLRAVLFSWLSIMATVPRVTMGEPEFRGHNTNFACCCRTGVSLSRQSHERDAICFLVG